MSGPALLTTSSSRTNEYALKAAFATNDLRRICRAVDEAVLESYRYPPPWPMCIESMEFRYSNEESFKPAAETCGSPKVALARSHRCGMYLSFKARPPFLRANRYDSACGTSSPALLPEHPWTYGL